MKCQQCEKSLNLLFKKEITEEENSGAINGNGDCKKKSRKEGNKTLETAIRYIKEQINSFVIDKNHYHKVMPLCVKKTRINKMYNRNYLFLAK